MNPFELLFGKKPIQQVNVRDITNQKVLPGRAIPPKYSPVGAVGGLVKNLNPAIQAAGVAIDVGQSIARGANPVDAALGPLGGLGASALAGITPVGRNPLVQIGAYAAGSNALPAAIDWLGKNAALSDRYALSKPSPQTGGFIGPVATGKGSIGPTTVPGRPVGTQATLGGKPAYWSGSNWMSAEDASRNAYSDAANRPVGTRSVLNGRPVTWQGKDLGWQEDKAGGAGGISTGASAAVADRAYREEAINTAQQTASNPLFQKYQVAELTKQYNEATDPNAKRDIGMQIWAQTNPTLAAKLKQGQSGYVQAQSAPGMSNAGGNLIGGLPMPSMNFGFATDVQPPVTMAQSFGAVIPGVGMASKTPMFDREQALKSFSNPLDIAKVAFGTALTPDPSVTRLTQDQLQALRAQYLQGLK